MIMNLMNRRLNYLFPNVKHTQKVVNALLLKRIDIKHMHVIARQDTDLKDLPEAGMFQKYDIRHSLARGVVIGSLLGVGAGLAFHSALSLPIGGLMIVAVLLGAILGAWLSTMIGMMTPNVELMPFLKAIEEENKILLMVDVPLDRIEEILSTIESLHEGANYQGIAPTYPQFP